MSEITPKRPTVTDEMVLAAATVVAGKMGDADAATIARRYHHSMDGYELAKELDKWDYWDTTREDMYALDEMEGLVERAISRAEKDWVEQHGISPPLPIGSRVRCPVRDRYGAIDSLCEYSAARYLVTPEEPDDRELAGKARWIIKFEDAQPA